jgi:hypothetical protein
MMSAHMFISFNATIIFLGHIVCELHLIFCLIPPHNISPWWAKQFLVYAQWFDAISSSNGVLVDPITHMVTLKRAFRTSGIAMGDVIPLNQISSLAHIVPRFGAKVNPHLTSSNSLHYSTTFISIATLTRSFTTLYILLAPSSHP